CVASLVLRQPQRLLRDDLVRQDREVRGEGATVDHDLAGAGTQAHACDRLLAATGGLDEGLGHEADPCQPVMRAWARADNGRSTGCCAWCGWVGPAWMRSFFSCARPSGPRGNMRFTANRTTFSGSRASRCSRCSVRTPPG